LDDGLGAGWAQAAIAHIIVAAALAANTDRASLLMAL
jgi:hypothetical protein